MSNGPVLNEAALRAGSFKMTPLRMGVMLVAVGVYWASIKGTEMSIQEFVTGFPAIVDLLKQMFPPDWAYLKRLGWPVIETLQIGIISTVVASILALPMAFLAAKNVSPHPVVYLPVRLFLTV
ncbi:MAG: hypothetical protein V3R37_07600, partial [Rhodospirillales bacterium]